MDEHEPHVYYQDGLPFVDLPEEPHREDAEVLLSYLLGAEDDE
jgi:hypothetical protein